LQLLEVIETLLIFVLSFGLRDTLVKRHLEETRSLNCGLILLRVVLNLATGVLGHNLKVDGHLLVEAHVGVTHKGGHE
jgi:hypothetical protein